MDTLREEFLVEDFRKPTGQKKYLYLIIYDIVDNKRRNRLFKFLKGYGTPVQRSCFESYLTESEYLKVERRICRWIDPEEDNVRTYQLHGLNRVFNYGTDNPNAYTEFIIF
ncbi:CRISPR-associated endoribonuclease Cas2 [Aedoeadaptatus ivorii]|uniref:CRISPR-associated endoribonuclease Cas2 n=1 Tax=Aedoeadaptatus ivorii TaxID=54006 RepID=A0A3S5C234_9FIRM|nr:CRISPR-associated endonuclease Cas2 [Peptoniphilus ivorii]VEJ34624.1 CRISPR-associated endoribonuclease Cas2 [Peptoniphilus ivorii]